MSNARESEAKQNLAERAVPRISSAARDTRPPVRSLLHSFGPIGRRENKRRIRRVARATLGVCESKVAYSKVWREDRLCPCKSVLGTYWFRAFRVISEHSCAPCGVFFCQDQSSPNNRSWKWERRTSTICEWLATSVSSRAQYRARRRAF